MKRFFLLRRADGYIKDPDIVAHSHLPDPGDRFQNILFSSVALMIQDLQDDEAAFGSHTLISSAAGFSASADQPRHMGAVSVVVVGTYTSGNQIQKDSNSPVKIHMGRDPGIEDCDGDPAAG